MPGRLRPSTGKDRFMGNKGVNALPSLRWGLRQSQTWRFGLWKIWRFWAYLFGDRQRSGKKKQKHIFQAVSLKHLLRINEMSDKLVNAALFFKPHRM